MTRRHRRAHLALWLLIGPLALALLTTALILRPARPITDGSRPNPEAPR